MLKKWYSVSLIIVIILFLMSCSGQVEQPNKLLKHAEFSEKDYVTLVTPNNELGFDMLESINPDQDGNIVISPTSLLMALSMIYHGSEGTTKDEIASLLHVNGIKDTDLLSANAALLNKLYRESQSINLSIANSLSLNQQFEFQDDFEKN